MNTLKKKEIVVEITRAELVGASHPHTYQTMLIEKLKSAGIPVKGTLFFTGVKFGTLVQEEDLKNDSYIFRWKP